MLNDFPAGDAPKPGAADLIKDTTTATFRQDVIAESMNRPVLVDFWAPWCGPCKQLTPVLEKAVTAAGGAVVLVKMNIDEHPSIAGQLGIQSIPAVIAFQRGQPVDGFMGAVPESQVKEFIARLAGPAGPSPIEAALEEATRLIAEGDLAGASEIYAAILEQEPDNVPALAGLAKIQLDAGELENARQVLAMVPEAKANDPALAGIRAALELAEQAASLGDLAGLQAQVEANPDDHQARFDLALGLAARGDRSAAVDHLIEIRRRDRDWNEDGARKQLLQFFEAWGVMDPDTIRGRRKLSTLLFS
ncbi:thioredoxin [Methylobacterium gregans]|uniref:Thioredoxin n=1 Tax=Methylobacterium gregans TaxID=374424 RepID=A0AA37HNN1_9HYPH|nr:thioredoxin [Methylobacterium gregans]MDQ0521442.1 putative thioredoxin [Methylobacterium gregans]GJD78112.1 Chaperedoxin [Methylobacterium gregans]GLS54606.1 thioredoxin [Methylobacterium gregans]